MKLKSLLAIFILSLYCFNSTEARQVVQSSSFHVKKFQGFLSGTVKDINGQPVSGATVSSGGISTTTNSVGKYWLELPEGMHAIQAKKGNCTSQTYPIEILDGQQKVLDPVLPC